ncbi:MAG: GNAT family N-acetyltransferase [Alphaproteobacteria bacterium]|nr:GNAT family N-acetyltransferase [Alphaproteobacteria bacterium]MCW5743839.1 GNAT family N-acetyltransferase [Alphaproteobacteria bacterium]
MDTILRTERLILRRVRASDAPAMHAILSDPAAMRYWSTLPHADLAQSEAWIEGTVASILAGRSDDFLVECDGAVIGKAGLWNGNEIGFLLAPSAWGKGYAREAVAAVIARGFAVNGHDEIRAEVDPRNEACLRLLTRLGFRETGRALRTWCIGGEWSDSVYLSLARPASGTAGA